MKIVNLGKVYGEVKKAKPPALILLANRGLLRARG
jgi:hypothetical protein